MERKVMIDIETTGLEVKRGFILEIALVIIAKSHSDEQFFVQAQFQTLLPYDGSPSSEFARKHQAELYNDCNQLYKSYAKNTADPIHHGVVHARKNILQFLKSNGFKKPEDIKLMGRNVRAFDLDWLYHHGILNKNEHHYRVYDLTSHEDIVTDITGIDSKTLRDRALLMASKPELPKGSEHRALYDCLYQLREYNGLLNLIGQKRW